VYVLLVGDLESARKGDSLGSEEASRQNNKENEETKRGVEIGLVPGQGKHRPQKVKGDARKSEPGVSKRKGFRKRTEKQISFPPSLGREAQGPKN
jgi:hypothetical protein